MQRPIVFIFNQFAITPDMPGGTRHYDFGKELVKRGYDIYIFASDFSYQKLEYLKLKSHEQYRIENVNGVNFVWVKALSYQKNNYRRILNQLSFARNSIRIAKRLYVRPDLIIGSSPTLFTAFASLNYATSIGADFIAEIRDLWPESLYSLKRTLKYHPYTLMLGIISRYIYKKSKKIIVFTEGNKKYISKMSRAKIAYIPNGVDYQMFSAKRNSNEIRKQYGFKGFTFVYTGAIGVANDIETIVDACKILGGSDINVEIFGSGPLRKEISVLIERYNLTNIRVHDPVEKNEIPDILNAADAAIITLKDVPLFRFGVSPNKLFEYMYAGLPVLCAIEGEMGDMIRDAGCGYVVIPGNPGDMAEKMRKLYRLPKIKKIKMGQKGRDYIKKHFMRKDLVNRLEEFMGFSGSGLDI